MAASRLREGGWFGCSLWSGRRHLSQHRGIAWRDGHRVVFAGAAQGGMDLRQAVTGHTHEQMVFGVIIDPIGRDRRAGEPAGAGGARVGEGVVRSEDHTSELQSLMRISYAVFCLKNKK